MNRILIVRMSALGDIVHALPVLAAIRAALPDVEIDWLADRKYAGLLAHVEGLKQIVHGRPALSAAVATLRSRRYDAAIDLQGLIKSAAMARVAGAPRVIGFERQALREHAAGWFYTESVRVPEGVHIIQKNLSVLPRVEIPVPATVAFPFIVPPSGVADDVQQSAAARGFRGVALINPGAAWPNKRWPAERFGAIAAHVAAQHQLAPFVLWGPGEESLADAVVSASKDAAVRAPHTSLGDLLALSRRAALIVSGDTGPLHLAAAMGTPIVGLYGPTWPERNGPWDPADVIVSRADACVCHHKRQCQRGAPCLDAVGIDEVRAAVDRRLARPTP